MLIVLDDLRVAELWPVKNEAKIVVLYFFRFFGLTEGSCDYHYLSTVSVNLKWSNEKFISLSLFCRTCKLSFVLNYVRIIALFLEITVAVVATLLLMISRKEVITKGKRNQSKMISRNQNDVTQQSEHNATVWTSLLGD